MATATGAYSAAVPTGPVYSIDVECVATGTDHNSRAVAQIALVDVAENVILNLYVKPDRPVVSYLTALTGLTAELLDTHGIRLHDALSTLRAALPRNATLVGQNIGQDVAWLQLREGVDFAGLIDLAGLYRAWNPHYKGWTVFGQDQVARVLLGWGPPAGAADDHPRQHDAVGDALKSIRLFRHYHALRATPGAWEAAQAALLAAPPGPSFAKRHPSYDGVCMGNRKACTCGAPFFS